LRRRGDVVEVETVEGEALLERDRRVATHAEITERPRRFLLPPPVHGEKDRVAAGIGVHAAGPLAAVVAVAAATGLRIAQLFGAERRLGLSVRHAGIAAAPGGAERTQRYTYRRAPHRAMMKYLRAIGSAHGSPTSARGRVRRRSSWRNSTIR